MSGSYEHTYPLWTGEATRRLAAAEAALAAMAVDEDERKITLARSEVEAARVARAALKRSGQAVSRNYKEVLAILLSFAVKLGRVYPSLDTISRLACVCRRTVVNALAWLRHYGFLTWARRIARTPTRFGMRVRQTSNAYRLGELSGLGRMAQAVFRRIAEGNNSPPSRSTRIKTTAIPTAERV